MQNTAVVLHSSHTKHRMRRTNTQHALHTQTQPSGLLVLVSYGTVDVPIRTITQNLVIPQRAYSRITHSTLFQDEKTEYNRWVTKCYDHTLHICYARNTSQM
jgi:hypothetical protein